MPDILRPDMKSILWLTVGFLVLPHVINMDKR